MKTKVITRENKHLLEPYYSEIVDAVHNGLDTVLFDDKRVNVVSVYTTDGDKTIVVEVVDARS
jgi:hypothetical protein